MEDTVFMNTTLINGCYVNNDTILEIGKFAILWNDFEFYYFGTECKDCLIKKFGDNFYVPAKKSQQFAQALFKWKRPNDMSIMEYVGRFLCPDGTRCGQEARKLMEQFLDAVRNNNTENDSDMTVGCLITIHRLRNNLMHGIKSIWKLDEQYEVFKAANGVLISLRRGHEELHEK